MRALYSITKRDNETVGRTFDFNPWLQSVGATFVSAQVDDSPDIIENMTVSNGVVALLLSAGNAGETYRLNITCVGTAGGQQLVRTTVLEVAVVGVVSAGGAAAPIGVQDTLGGSSTTFAPSVRAVNEALAGKANTADGITSAERARIAGLDGEFAARIAVTQKGVANGVASLDGTGKLPASQLPDVAVSDYLGDVANEAAMLALVGGNGDFCTRVDLGTTWIVVGTPTSSLSNWRQLGYPASPVTSVAGKTGSILLNKSDVGLSNVDNTADAAKPVSTAQASALAGKSDTGHTHSTANVAGLDAALAGKSDNSHGHAIANVTSLQAALDGKAAATHVHTVSNVNGLQALIDEMNAAINATGDIDGGTPSSTYGGTTPVGGGDPSTDFGSRKPVNGGTP
jgi:hypothetical protein